MKFCYSQKMIMIKAHEEKDEQGVGYMVQIFIVFKL